MNVSERARARLVASCVAAALSLIQAFAAGQATPPEPPAADHAEVRQEVTRILDDSRYRFCHDREYALSSAAHRWCDVVDDHDPRCPSFTDACKLAAVHSTRSGEGCAPAPGGNGEHGSRHGDDERATEHSLKLELGPRFGAVVRAVFFLLLGAFIVYVVRAIVRNMRKHDEPEQSVSTPVEPAAVLAMPAPAQAEKDVERLLARARAAADRGEFEPAISDAYAALLRKLDGDGLIEVQAARTNGEYVRALQARPDLMHTVRGIVRDVECVQFGAAKASRERFRAVYEQVLPIVGKAMAVLLLFGLLPTSSCSDTPEQTSLGPLGTEAIVDLLDRHGVSFDSSVVLPRQLSGAKTLLLVDADLDADEWKEILAWAARDRGTIVAVGRSLEALPSAGMLSVPGSGSAPRELSTEGAMFPTKVELRTPPGRRIDVQDGVAVVPLLRRGDETYAAYRRLPIEPSSSPGSKGESEDADGADDDFEDDDADESGAAQVEPPQAQAVPDNGAPGREPSALSTTQQVLLGRRLAGTLVGIADARLFQSVALTAGDNAAFLLALFREMPSSVVLWDALSGRGSSTPMEAIHRAHLTPVIAHLFLFFGLLFLYRGIAFGKLREPPAQSSRRFVDHVRALGNAYERANASTHVVGLYSAWALDRLRERAKMTGRTGLVPIAEALSAQTGRSEAEVMGVLLEAYSAKEEVLPPSAARPSQAPARPSAKPADGSTEAADFGLMQKLDRFLGSNADPKSSKSR